jgi:hypothetical protein
MDGGKMLSERKREREEISSVKQKKQLAIVVVGFSGS